MDEVRNRSFIYSMKTYEHLKLLTLTKLSRDGILVVFIFHCLSVERYYNKLALLHLVIWLTWLDVIVANFKASAAAAITYGSLPQCSAPRCPQLVSHQP